MIHLNIIKILKSLPYKWLFCFTECCMHFELFSCEIQSAVPTNILLKTNLFPIQPHCWSEFWSLGFSVSIYFKYHFCFNFCRMGLMYLFERMLLTFLRMLRTAHFHLTWDLQLTWALVSLVLHCDCIVTYWVFQKVATFVLEICLRAVLVLWCDTSEPVNCSILVSGCWHLAVLSPSRVSCFSSPSKMSFREQSYISRGHLALCPTWICKRKPLQSTASGSSTQQ